MKIEKVKKESTRCETKFFTVEDAMEYSPVSAAETHQTDLTDRDEKQFANRIVNGKGHRSISEHNVYHINFHNINRHIAEVIGERRLLSISERSQRRVPVTGDGFFMDDVSKHLFSLYERGLKEGMKMEDARYVLDMLCTTSLRVTINQLELAVLIKRLEERSYLKAGCELVAQDLRKFLVYGGWKLPKVERGEDPPMFGSNLCREVTWNCNTNITSYSGPRYAEFSDVELSGYFSSVAYQQLKRHRMSTPIRSSYSTSNHYVPYDHPVFDEAIEYAKKHNRIIGASLCFINMKVNFRSLRNIFKERTYPAAQKEIRNYFCWVKEDMQRSFSDHLMCYLLNTEFNKE